MKISLVQADIQWEAIAENLNHYDQLLEGLETELVILPEMFQTGFSMNAPQFAEKMDGRTMNWMLEKAVQLDAAVVGSLMIEEDGEFFNRMIWMMPDGTYGKYDKRHLFRMAKEHHVYGQGDERIILKYKDFRFCTQICYDLRFPVWSRNEDDYDCLIYVANWPAVRAYPWKQLLIARAIENLSYVIGVNRCGTDGKGFDYSGDSALIDFKGHKVVEVSGKEKVISSTLDLAALEQFRKDFPAMMDADDFAVL